MDVTPQPTDTYRDTFLKFLAEGMTHEEALAQFDYEKFSRAALAEMLSNEAVCVRDENWRTAWVTNDSRKLPALFALLLLAQRQQADTQDFERQAVPLMLAGWTSETPGVYRNNSTDPYRQCPVMSLYWRAPSKRPGKPGRRYLSTNQAFNAMKKAQA